MHITLALEGSETWITVSGADCPPDTSSLGRWVAIEGDRPIAGIEARRRPDGRVFVSLHGSDRRAHPLLIERVDQSIAGPLHAVCRDGHPPDRQTLIDLGFEETLIEDLFTIDFRRAMVAFSRAWVPSGHSIISASAVDTDRLFELDNRLRRLVPGTEAWAGDREMFEAEIAEAPPFDPDGYLVMRDERSGDLVGLIRFWRNASGPRLGMLGVLPTRRRTTLGPALLEQGLEAASTWGSDQFVTETSRTNRHVHRRLIALGADLTGSLAILKR